MSGMNRKEESAGARKEGLSGIKVGGFPLPLYFMFLFLTMACLYTHSLPRGMVGGYLLLMVLGDGLFAIGSYTPVVKTYLGGSVLCTIGGAVLAVSGLIPEDALAVADEFINHEDFLVFYLAALITGSLFNIDRELLLKGTVRLLPTAVISLAAGVGVICLLGMLQGLSFLESMLFIAVPMTSGGMTAGAAPLSSIYAQVLSGDAGQILTRIAPATVLGNVIAIIYGAVANRIGIKRPELSGGGRLVNDGKKIPERPPMKPTFQNLGMGLVITMVFYGLGSICHHFVPIVPIYAWMIILVVVVKGMGVLPDEFEDAAREWGGFAVKAWTAMALTGIGLTLIDLGTILATLTPLYLFTVVAGVTAITLTAGFVGARFMGFFPIESAIAAGMCTTNMGGSGNVAVLSSAERMDLLPFAQIVTRSCGALMLTLGGILVQFLK